MNTDLAKKLNDLTTAIDGMVSKARQTLTCKKGCFSCCYESVYVTREEAKLLVDYVRNQGRDALDALRAKVKDWMRRFMLSDSWDTNMPAAVAYRSLRLACPILGEDGACTAYEVRPIGCRMHMTKFPKAQCEDLTQRSRAKFLDPMGTAIAGGHTNVVFAMTEATIAASDAESVTLDHLVILMAEALGMPAPPSGSRVNHPMPAGRPRPTTALQA